MVRSKVVSLRECFSMVRDPRREHQRFHRLWDIIAITICAVISGAFFFSSRTKTAQLRPRRTEAELAVIPT